jgi:hypothetical protein
VRRLLIFSIATLMLLVQISSVSACGGGAPFFIQWLDERDTIVHATVLEVDDRGYNAILQIDEYFKENGGKYLAVVRWPAALETVSNVRGYDTSCLYDGGGEKWIAGSEGYFALSSNHNGTFTDFADSGIGAPHFFVQDGRVEFHSFDASTDVEAQILTLPANEFENLLLSYGKRASPVEPDINSVYPLMHFLNIITESGSHYQLNPDRSVIQLNEATVPIAVSEDGSHVAFKMDDNRVGFQYLALERKPEKAEVRFDGGWLIPQLGQSVMFSPDSNFAAVWDDRHLAIYMFDNYEHGGYGQEMNMQAVATSDFSNLGRQPIVVWSADSTSIAFEDQRGIWLWNIFEKAEPELVVKSDVKRDMPLTDISASGRYIRYVSANIWTLLDTQTGEQFDNAIATPDESNLIFIQTEYPETTPDINRKGDRDCHVPLAESCPIYIEQSNIVKEFWYKNDQIAILSCFEDRCYVGSYSWQLAISSDYNYEHRLDFQIPLVHAFAYDLWNDKPAVAIDEYTLEFGLYPNWQRDEPSDPALHIDSVDLSAILDSPIVDLNWGQPIFYERNQLY